MYFEKLLKIYFKFQNFKSFAKFKNIIKIVYNYFKNLSRNTAFGIKTGYKLF